MSTLRSELIAAPTAPLVDHDTIAKLDQLERQTFIWGWVWGCLCGACCSPPLLLVLHAAWSAWKAAA